MELDPLEIYNQIKNKEPKRVSKKDLNLHLLIINEIENYCHKILQSYVKQNDLLIENVTEV